MFHRKRRSFLLLLLGLVCLVQSSTLLGQMGKLRIGDKFTNSRGLTYTVTGASISDLSIGFLVWLNNFLLNATYDLTEDHASTSGADHSILGVAPGALVSIPRSVNSCCCAAGVTLDPLGLFVLTTDSVRNRVCVHRSDPETGALTPVQGSPFSTGGNSAQRIAMDPAGEFVFVANSSSNNITVFSFNLDTGALTPVPGSPFAAGTQPLDVTTDGFGRFLYAANNLSNSISAFPSTEALGR